MDEYARDGTDLLPVLASRERRVEEAMAAAFPGMATSRSRRTFNWRGWFAGRAASDSASLNKGARIGTG